MNNFKKMNKALTSSIHIIKNASSLFVENPDKDFTRERKLSIERIIHTVIGLEAGSLKDELFKSFDYSSDTPTVSALVQARDKIKIDAFKTVFDLFNEKTKSSKLYKGYRLLAIDGCEVPINNSFYDEETTLLQHGSTVKPYSAYHLNPIYDLLECTYDDLIIQGQAKMNENDAFCVLVDRYRGDKAIFISDRGYESYNGFEHVVKSGNKYLIRVKDINSKTSLTKSLGPFPDTDDFDIDVSRTLTRRYTNEIKSNPHKYKYCPQNMRFDYMDKDNPYYDFKCRIVRFKISDDTFETIITNLERDTFGAEEIKYLYNLRWGIETSFRLIKYALDLNAFHSKKRKLIQQEIYARLILYNFCQRIVQDIKIPQKKRLHYQYQVNFTRAFHIIREFLKTKKGGSSPPVDHLIAKEVLPVRPGRSDTRHVSPKKVVCFNYRYD